MLTWGVLVAVITCVGVCVSAFGHKATCVFEPVFSAFLITYCLRFCKKNGVGYVDGLWEELELSGLQLGFDESKSQRIIFPACFVSIALPLASSVWCLICRVRRVYCKEILNIGS